MKFLKLAEVFEELEKISAGNEIREVLSKLFKECDSNNIDIVCYFLLGKISADYDGKVLNMADSLVIEGIKLASGISKDAIIANLRETGDLGLTVQKLITKNKSFTLTSFMEAETEELTIEKVFEVLNKIAETDGAGSQNLKVKLLTSLLQNASPLEAKYIVRITLEQLRLGAAAMSILDALSISICGSKEKRPILEHAYNLCSDIGLVAKKMKEHGLDNVLKIDVQVGKPIRMMLAQRVKKLAELEEKLGFPIALEEKYDGERMQIHKKGDKVKIFSRRLDDITNQYPDIVDFIKNNVKGDNFIVEGEGVAVDKEKNLMAFQHLMQRKRKHDVHFYVKKVPVVLILFDILFLDGESFLNVPYLQRRRKLESIVNPNECIRISTKVEANNVEEISEFFEKAIANRTEGIMAKMISDDAIYRAGARAWLWVKWKKDYMEQLNDTLDLTIIGAFAGKGKRTGKYGAVLCACYNKVTEKYETFCKLGTGFSDAVLEELPKKLEPFLSTKKPNNVVCLKELEPDYWFNPGIITEVVGAEITKSPIHTCALEKYKNYGLAVRFPRFIKFREKKIDEITTTEEIVQMFE